MAIVIPDEMEAAFVEFMSNQQHYVYNPNGADFIKCRGCGAIAECTNHQKMEFEPMEHAEYCIVTAFQKLESVDVVEESDHRRCNRCGTFDCPPDHCVWSPR